MVTARVVVIGAAGAVGRLFARTLARDGCHVTGVDRVSPDAESDLARFIECDINTPSPVAIAALSDAEWVLVCLPEAIALAALPTLTARLAAGALWIDTLSVKKPVCAALARVAASTAAGVELLSINPLFAPSLGFAGQTVAVVPVAAGVRAAAFLEWLESAGARVVCLKASDHDQHSAATQVATHAALLAFGIALDAMGADPAAALKVSTPPYRLLLSLLDRVVTANPEVYWDIQHSHPLGIDTRTCIADAVNELQRAVATGDEESFSNAFARIRSRLGPASESLRAIARAAIDATSLPIE